MHEKDTDYSAAGYHACIIDGSGQTADFEK
ncbi:hypothetical protein SDC9_159315 [bioreactor metagenome]|uniref:Uncharacterized protein n=1 Tax=bioreactor metagenome TaxID=1076179 RepID=A0A645FCA7_9ZZZZ